MSNNKSIIRMERIQNRVRSLQLIAFTKTITHLVLTSTILVFALLNLFHDKTSGPPGRILISGRHYGTMLLEGAGGYVLAGVIAFTVGVLVTVRALHMKEKRRNMSVPDQNHASGTQKSKGN